MDRCSSPPVSSCLAAALGLLRIDRELGRGLEGKQVAARGFKARPDVSPLAALTSANTPVSAC